MSEWKISLQFHHIDKEHDQLILDNHKVSQYILTSISTVLLFKILKIFLKY